MRIGFIGGGNMGQAMIAALLSSGRSAPPQVFACDIAASRTDVLKQTYGIHILSTPREIIHSCDIVVFAVKPQSIGPLLEALRSDRVFKDAAGRKRLISIAAGIRIEKLEESIYSGLDEKNKARLPVIRVMPNTPALVGAGISGICANAYTGDDDLKIARALLSAMGEVFDCREADMDAVTAISGSGPAYLFYLAEAMIRAGVRLGFDATRSTALVRFTLKGAVALMEKLNLPPEELRRRVTSPGGTTEAAIGHLDQRAVKQAIEEAILAAAKRAEELSASA